MTTQDVDAMLERFDQVLEPPLDDDEAVAVIEDVVAPPHAADYVWVPELLWQLGQAHARAGRYDDAIAAQERAIVAGEDGTPDPRATIGAYHLQAGRREVAAGIFAELREQDPEDPWLFNSVGMDYQDVGDHEEAVRWLDEGLRLAIELDVGELVGQLANLRRDSLDGLGARTRRRPGCRCRRVPEGASGAGPGRRDRPQGDPAAPAAGRVVRRR